MKLTTTFPHGSEYRRTRVRLDVLSLPFEVISPEPGFRRVGVPAIVM